MIGTPHVTDVGAAKRTRAAMHLQNQLDAWMPGTLEAALAPPTQRDIDLRDALHTVWRVQLQEDYDAARRPQR